MKLNDVFVDTRATIVVNKDGYLYFDYANRNIGNDFVELITYKYPGNCVGTTDIPEFVVLWVENDDVYPIIIIDDWYHAFEDFEYEYLKQSGCVTDDMEESFVKVIDYLNENFLRKYFEEDLKDGV